MPDPELADRLITAIATAHSEGSPIPGDDPIRWKRITRIAIQRWRTFPRRHSLPATRACHTEDLARGLLARCARHGLQSGPPDLSEYRAFAAYLAPILTTAPPATYARRPSPGW